jgi:hypothetical protein
MKLFNSDEYRELATLFRGYAQGDEIVLYTGYRPDVFEAPNGDGQVDAVKHYLHVALKYNPPWWAQIYLARAHFEACRIAEALNVPAHLYPRVEDGTLRVLDYPPGAGSAEHTDFDLFTVHCYRSHPADFVRLDAVDSRAEAIDPDVHLGEIAEIAGIGKATRHFIPARPYAQQAIVYFAMSGKHAPLNGGSVGDWLKERYARSRVSK